MSEASSNLRTAAPLQLRPHSVQRRFVSSEAPLTQKQRGFLGTFYSVVQHSTVYPLSPGTICDVATGVVYQQQLTELQAL